VAELNGDHVPETEEYGISSVVFHASRAFDPAALWHFVTRRLDSGEFGTVLRSKGFFALASRPGVTGLWSQAGTVARFEPQGVAKGPRQELVFIGVDLQGEALLAALRDCLGEATGPDPFPAWEPVHSP
jgi:G3E family GTPase